VGVITGGAQGIGQAIALAFARTGADIAFTYHGATEESHQRARATAAALRRLGCRVIFAPTNAADDAATEEFMGRVVAELGRIDILVNNVGGADTVPPGGYVDKPMSYWRQQFDKNFFSAVACSRLAVKDMLRRRSGSVINISSVHAARIFNTRFMPYSCSKVAMNSLTRHLAVELAPHNIRVNCIAPGLIRTALTKRRYDAAWWAAVNERIPMHRPGEPAEVAEVALFLASRRASYLTGQVIYVDGGGADGGWDL
jgi:NAD(P)-dependent dehydrogenase (short-subunit alcohol dehydrogenase family)